MVNQSKYLRISVTAQCNLSCFFCHKEGNNDAFDAPLTIDDFEFICKIAKTEGFTKFKITGGEPTTWLDLPSLISRLVLLGIDDLSMITNGTNLLTEVSALKKGGLKRINVTLNSLNPEKFHEITGASQVVLDNILAGIDLAIKNGYDNLKINFVYVDEHSVSDLYDLLEFVRQRSLTLVVLPILTESNSNITLLSIYNKIKEMGIKSEMPYDDDEGITKTLIELNSGAKVILRITELGDLKPYVFCDQCKSRDLCREGIFPLRLSSCGILIPCLASHENRISIYNAMRNKDEEFIRNAIHQIRGWNLKSD